MKIYGQLVELGIAVAGEESIARIVSAAGHQVIVRDLTNEQIRSLAPLFMEPVTLTIEASA